MELILPILTMIWSFILISLYCEFGENVSVHFNDVHRCICDSDWYLFPYEIQKMLPIILIATQKSVEISGFGNISFTRETFKLVLFWWFCRRLLIVDIKKIYFFPNFIRLYGQDSHILWFCANLTTKLFVWGLLLWLKLNDVRIDHYWQLLPAILASGKILCMILIILTLTKTTTILTIWFSRKILFGSIEKRKIYYNF